MLNNTVTNEYGSHVIKISALCFEE